MKLNYKRTILIGLAFLSISAFWQMYDNIIPLILKNSFELGETVTGVIMAADNILALFLLPSLVCFPTERTPESENGCLLLSPERFFPLYFS